MRYAPSSAEQATFTEMSSEERVHYALARIVETEEIWSLGGEEGWLIRDGESGPVISIWPYRVMAEASATGEYAGKQPISVSLEHFFFGLLPRCRENGIFMDVNPEPNAVGRGTSASELHEVLEGMMETGSYFVEG